MNENIEPLNEQYFVSQELYELLSRTFEIANCDIHNFHFDKVHIVLDNKNFLILEISVWQYVFVEDEKRIFYKNEFSRLRESVEIWASQDIAQITTFDGEISFDEIYIQKYRFSFIVKYSKKNNIPILDYKGVAINEHSSPTIGYQQKDNQ